MPQQLEQAWICERQRCTCCNNAAWSRRRRGLSVRWMGCYITMGIRHVPIPFPLPLSVLSPRSLSLSLSTIPIVYNWLMQNAWCALTLLLTEISFHCCSQNLPACSDGALPISPIARAWIPCPLCDDHLASIHSRVSLWCMSINCSLTEWQNTHQGHPLLGRSDADLEVSASLSGNVSECYH